MSFHPLELRWYSSCVDQGDYAVQNIVIRFPKFVSDARGGQIVDNLANSSLRISINFDCLISGRVLQGKENSA